ncbi:MAG: glucose-1-phosphate adenylyltransferase [Acidimicrobiales bacterium]|nr:glucose-1-phosphate adenylyltransferase [Acidimicrobiia bacterium]NNC80039.1 glucose-1-phosphate adenylyltransferase [Acidimicrobiales bacterium]RZV48380.1 MAG: glucose-1-phosphate adenylyltransferase [Acidimicrobiales bacterium]
MSSDNNVGVNTFEARRRPNVLAMVLAGGEGKRLMPLTAVRAKPAVPFGGRYRLIDFAISNLVNSGYRKIVVLTQYKSHSLDVHISRTWSLSSELGNYITTVPAQMRHGPRWFTGSVDAIYQNFNLIDDERPEHIIVFGADHIYRMDARQMLEAHIASGGGATVAGVRVPRSDASQFGIISTEPLGTRIREFLEKPEQPEGLVDSPDEVLASMGNYIFSTELLMDMVAKDADDETSNHDIGGDLLPRIVASGDAHVYDYTLNEVAGDTPKTAHYWRDVGTIDSYFAANLDLIAHDPKFNLYNTEWPIFSYSRNLPPARFESDGTTGTPAVNDSIISTGTIVRGARVAESVVSTSCRIDPGANVERSVVLDNVHIGAGSTIRNCVVDKNVVIPPNTVIGADPELDSERFTVSPGGIVVIPKNSIVQ